MRATPNDMTRVALRHPLLWAVGSALVIALVGLVIFGDWRAGAVGGPAMMLVNWYLWRPSGPGRAWAVDAARRSPDT